MNINEMLEEIAAYGALSAALTIDDQNSRAFHDASQAAIKRLIARAAFELLDAA